jgi:hypothetical protein
MTETAEILQTLKHLQNVFEDLAVRGLRSAGAGQRAALDGLRTELERIGANHLAERVAAVATAMESDDRAAAPALLRAQASVRVFERVLTLDTAQEVLAVLAQSSEDEDSEGDDA